MTDDADEILDLVDDQDQVIGAIGRRAFQEVISSPPGNIRAAEAFIINSKGEIWVPRRSHDKAIAPGGLDFSAAEHVGQGEAYAPAMVRGFQEELNMSISEADLELHGILPPEPTLPVFRAIYLLRSDQTPTYNPHDFSDAEWLSPAELISRLAAGESSKRNLAPTVKKVFSL